MPTKERRLKEQAKQTGNTGTIATLEAPTLEAPTGDTATDDQGTDTDQGAIAPTPSAPTYPRREALGIGHFQVQKAATFCATARSAWRSPDELLSAASEFEAAYFQWEMQKVRLIAAREAVSLAMTPPSFVVPTGSNLPYDGLLAELNKAESDTKRAQVLRLAEQRLEVLERQHDDTHTAMLWFAILADFLDEQKLWQPWQQKFNDAIALAEQILNDARADVAAQKAGNFQSVIGYSMALRQTFGLSSVGRLPRWKGKPESGYSLDL